MFVIEHEDIHGFRSTTFFPLALSILLPNLLNTVLAVIHEQTFEPSSSL
jgi:hypothetical protein